MTTRSTRNARKINFEETLTICNEINDLELRSMYLRKIITDQMLVTRENAEMAMLALSVQLRARRLARTRSTCTRS